MTDKSLGQIAYESDWGGVYPWDEISIKLLAAWEKIAQTVAAHVRAMDAKQAVPLSAYQQVEKALWTAHEGSLLHNGAMHNITISCGTAHAALLAKKQATAQPIGCADLTDDDIDQIITWQDDCGRGDIGFQGFCDNIIKAFSTQSVGRGGSPAVQLGPKLFSFASHQDWVDSASIAWNSHGVEAQHTVCVDQLGKLLGWGQHFATARDEGQFPVDVYLLRADMANPPQPEPVQGGAT